MATSPDDTKAELLEAAVARVHERFDGGQAAALERFLRAYYEHVAPEDLLDRSDLDLYGAAVAHWKLARERRPGELKINVYTPNVEEHGWKSLHTVVETVTDDMPFLVDSVSMAVTRQGSAIHLVIRPIMHVKRDDEGRLLEVDSKDGLDESLIHVEIDRRTDPEALDRLRADVHRALSDVEAAVEDWPAMRERTGEIAAVLERKAPPVEQEEVAEARDLLEWMRDGHFTFLGYREYEMHAEHGQDILRAVPGSGLGILRETGEGAPSSSFAQLPPEVRRLARAKTLLNLTKANSRATVHRPSYLDYVGVKRFDEAGEVAGERRFLGLYTHTAYSASPWEIPVLRRKVTRVRERSGLPRGSHDDKALVEIIETYPRDELFQMSEDELYEIALGILHLGERRRVRLFARRDCFGRFFSCLVYLPRERFHTENRRRIQDILQEAFGGVSVDYSSRVSESVLARFHFVIYTKPGAVPEYDAAEIEARLAAATRAWTDDLRDALFEQLDEERAGPLFERYGEAFPGAYRDDFSAHQAVLDINRLERLDPAGDFGMSLYLPLEAESGVLRFKLLRSGGPVLLSDVLPVLENMGVRVIDERPYEIRPSGEPPAWIYDFGLRHDEGMGFEADRVRETFQDAFARTWRGDAENDGFNRLVLSAQLTAREITILRAVAKYLRQAGSTFSQAYMEAALGAHPVIAMRLVELFRLRLDPARFADTDAKARALDGEIAIAIDGVESLDEDRILRSFLRVVRAVLRTNYFQADEEGHAKPYLTLKLNPDLIPDLPEPRPMAEVFVYSPRVEAVHLRGGRIARGGIRWSDRREDFRTEVLGLMKAQTVKNAVIVPVGAKGGFVVKRPPRDRDALRAEVVECYRTFMRGLLDVTDTMAGGEVVAPPDVVRHDGDDPYLVVAADKGTATFSDIANELSAGYGFWLGDAFASGGSAGYDHKKLGITARGAWESVERHFQELGTDIHSVDFTVIGIGDMSGDVFGNGMLRSRHIKLIGAFDHRHVFLDPDPDPEASFAERERLFALPASSWADYDDALISEGGGAFPRTAKSIALTPQVQSALGVEAKSLTPAEVIRALLRAPVDLLWNGGIGTYVKAREERHAEVGDKANDAVRVDAEELRCRVIGEGGNLGCTQRARVAFALGGGRVFMDAIDNSAGVDCSDHEVNIKILLDRIVADGDLTPKQRNGILTEMEEEVAALVLRDNYGQARAISTSTAQAAAMVEVHQRYVRNLEQSGALNRELEGLPSDEVFGERDAAGTGLTAPEFAILLSYTKIALSEELLASDLPDDPYLARELERYFPTLLRERYASQFKAHPLAREIVVSRVVNDLVNRTGTTFAFRLRDETGAAGDDIARAYTVAREVFGLHDLWAEIEALDGQVAAETQVAMLLKARVLVERASRWLLRNRRRPLEIEDTISRFAPGAAALAEDLPGLLGQAELDAAAKQAEELVAKAVPPLLAERVAHLETLVPTLDIVEIAAAAEQELTAAAAVYFGLGSRLELHWLRSRIVALPRETRWEAMARAALRDDLYAEQAALTAEVLRSGADGPAASERLETWLAENAGAVERCLQMLSEIRAVSTPDLARLSVAVREIRNLIHSSGAVETAAEPSAVPASLPEPD